MTTDRTRDPIERYDYYGSELTLSEHPDGTEPGAHGEPAAALHIDENGVGRRHLLGPMSAVQLAAWLLDWAAPHFPEQPTIGSEVVTNPRARVRAASLSAGLALTALDGNPANEEVVEP